MLLVSFNAWYLIYAVIFWRVVVYSSFTVVQSFSWSFVRSYQNSNYVSIIEFVAYSVESFVVCYCRSQVVCLLFSFINGVDEVSVCSVLEAFPRYVTVLYQGLVVFMKFLFCSVLEAFCYVAFLYQRLPSGIGITYVHIYIYIYLHIYVYIYVCVWYVCAFTNNGIRISLRIFQI